MSSRLASPPAGAAPAGPAKYQAGDGGREAGAIDYTVRKCRWCGRKYVYPKGGKRPGCANCQPELWADE